MKRGNGCRTQGMVASFATGPGGVTVITLLRPPAETNNRLAIRPSRSAILARQIHDRLQTAGYLALRGVDCEVRDGVAYLDGRLRSHYLKQIAQAAAMQVDGIVGIENRIDVIPATVVDDRRRFGGLIYPEAD
jgi:osmotically-inducible protein OsmY